MSENQPKTIPQTRKVISGEGQQIVYEALGTKGAYPREAIGKTGAWAFDVLATHTHGASCRSNIP